MKLRLAVVLAVACPIASSIGAALTPDQINALPPPADHHIDFASEIKPIFEASCIRCHGRGRARGGFQIDTRESLLKGGDSGPAATVGNSAASSIIALVAGVDPDEVMPKKGKRLTTNEVAILRAWIDQGMPWDASINFAPVPPNNFDPRQPAIPGAPLFGGRDEGNPLDSFLDAYFKKNHVESPSVVSDRVFARRAYLDAIGLLPPPKELEAFVASQEPNKRDALVKQLLSRNEAYAQKWLSFWNDLLRNDYKGAGYIDGGREQITRWLYSALETNMPYDQFVTQLVDPSPASEGFTKGIVWRGVVNASQMPQMQAAQNISQVFMGVNLKCASCHDSFINDWQLSDSYGLANVFSDQPLEINRCDVPTGQKAATKFIFPQLGDIPATTNRAERLAALARDMTCPRDGRLTRTLVNRLWARLLGRGLVEPLDDMQQNAWDKDMLDWLAQDFVDAHYDMKHTLARIMTSRAYQLPAVDSGEQAAAHYVFRGPAVRRLSAEEFRDALAALTGVACAKPDADLPLSPAERILYRERQTPKWIWDDPRAAEKTRAGTMRARKIVRLAQPPTEANILVSCDNAFTLFVNGHKAGEGSDVAEPQMIDIRGWLKTGKNVIAIEAVNYTPDGKALAAGAPTAGTENPAGLFVYARIRARRGKREKVMDFVSDASWMVSDPNSPDWKELSLHERPWKPANELGPVNMAPWNLDAEVVPERFASLLRSNVRASLVAADPLQTALGRPNREQVASSRATEATTLQAMELTNGKTLADILHRGAAHVAEEKSDGRGLVRALYEQAVGREPTGAELDLAAEMVGEKPTPDGTEDLLWAMAMLPEFQLIY